MEITYALKIVSDMSEAQPSKKTGGHAYGRRHQQMSNTAEEGELCIYTGHSLGRFSTHSMRYDSHQACTRCVAAAREGRLSFDIDRLLKRERKRALKFWSQVAMNAGTGLAPSINALNNLNLLGDDMVFLVPRSTILSVLQCGLRGGTWDSQELKQLVETSIAVIPSTSSPKELESLLTKTATWNPLS